MPLLAVMGTEDGVCWLLNGRARRKAALTTEKNTTSFLCGLWFVVYSKASQRVSQVEGVNAGQRGIHR